MGCFKKVVPADDFVGVVLEMPTNVVAREPSCEPVLG